MSVHYKFKSALEYDTVTFDGLHISVKDLKNAIVQQKRIGKNTDFDLQVTNAQTKEVYDDEQALIPKNTSLLIARIPLAVQNKAKTWEGYGNDSVPMPRSDEGGPAAKAVDLSSLDASEDDKIRAMMSQSTQDYDPSNYMKIRGANQVGAVPSNYRCYKCHQTGHWIKDCPLGQGTEQIEIKKSTGIPRSFMVPVEGPQVQGAMMTPYGSYAVPVLDHQTYTQKQQPAPAAPPPVQKTDIPEDLVCTICSDLLTDAVMIPCCGNSFCDECIRSSLVESEHECPDCHERDISPGTLIPNRFLRNSVANFKNTTGYVKRQIYKPAMIQQQQNPTTVVDKEVVKVPDDAKESEKSDAAVPESAEKTIISEADSTEAPKTPVSDGVNATPVAKETEVEKKIVEEKAAELPPGVSPIREKTPEAHPITVNTHHRDRERERERDRDRDRERERDRDRERERDRHNQTSRQKPERSPRRIPKQRSPPYQESLSNMEERPGTPTVDEPGMGGVNNGDTGGYQSNAPYPSGPPPVVIPNTIAPPHHIQQVPPPGMGQSSSQYPPAVQQYPPNQGMLPHGPPPNFRLPPPGANAPPNYMSGMYNVPPRPMFDPSRPPMQGPPPNYQNYSNRPRGRDYPPRGMRGRTPPGIIDDPLEAFNRMLREKDERERRAKQRKGRSYSRSSSRSYSRSPRRRSRTPRRRSRSRSKSFSISRSRSRSYTPANRASPYRDYSPRRRPPSRYRTSPQRSPSRYRYKEGPDRTRDRDYDRDRDRDRERDRDRDRDRDYLKRDRDNGRGYSRERANDYHYYDSYERDKGMPPRGGSKWAPPPRDGGYYPQEHQTMQYHQPQGPPPMQQHPVSNRYPREQYPPYKPDHIPPLIQQSIIPPRRYEDVAPPGTEQPLPPGEEAAPRYEDRYSMYENRTTRPEQIVPEHYPEVRERERDRDREREIEQHERYPEHEVERRYEGKREERKHERYPSRSPRRSKDRNDSPDKHKRKKREETPKKEEKEVKEKKKEHSDDEKSKKNKEKKKKRDKKDTDKKKKKDKKEKREHKKEKEKEKEKKDEEPQTEEVGKEEVFPNSPKPDEEPPIVEKEESPKPKAEADLYGDILSEGIDNTIVESYGKIDDVRKKSVSPVDRNKSPDPEPAKLEEAEQHETCKEYEDVLELYTGELKSELDKEMLAPLPEKSKWEMDEEPNPASSELEAETKTEKSNKVTNEVLKRAENAIFAKAINAIRPIEIKKISSDRVKLYSGEKEEKKDESEVKAETEVAYSFEETPTSATADTPKTEADNQKPVRLSVKERLGCKVDELDRIVRVDRSYDRNRSRTLSPLAKRSQDIRNERRVEVDDKRRERERERERETRERERMHERDRHHRNYRNNDRRDELVNRNNRRDRERNRNTNERERKERSRSRHRKEEEKREKRKRSRSKSEDKKQHKKRDKKIKKERPKKHHKKEEEKELEKPEEKPKPVDKRKPTLDESNFVPDYDIETESEEDKKKNLKETVVTEQEEAPKKQRAKIEEKESSSSESSSSSSDDDKKKKKHKKHSKKKKRKESSSSSSESDSSSSEDEKERKKRRHKRKQKKKKKSKHK